MADVQTYRDPPAPGPILTPGGPLSYIHWGPGIAGAIVAAATSFVLMGCVSRRLDGRIAVPDLARRVGLARDPVRLLDHRGRGRQLRARRISRWSRTYDLSDDVGRG